ncbi:MAG TPA: hypothetical protein VKB12_15140 [Pyrinomonadaceae bacterium]|nr:hypothetical protein [Pyrinomonadaceae bacterium]
MSGVGGTARPDLLKTLTRGLMLRCPVCGESGVFRAPFHVRHHCPACRALFQREAGFFVGAIMLNVVVTEGAVMFAFGLCLLTLSGGSALTLPVLFAVALLFPVLFYHHSWSLWLAGDHVVERLPKQGPED